MKKNVFVYALFALLLICVMVSCNNNGTKPQEVIAKNPATLKVNYFRQYYAVGDGPEKLVGTLSYTAEGGSSINTIDISSEEVTKTGFDTKEPAEGKTLKLTYKGIDCVVTYNVVKQETVDLYGEFIVADKTTLYFNKDKKTVDKETWENWFDYYTFAQPKTSETLDYTVGISSSGMTIVKVDGTNYYPDANGGLRSYPTFNQYFDDDSKYSPNTRYFYVSTDKEDGRKATNEHARDKYLVMAFDYTFDPGSEPEESYIAYIWFVADLAVLDTGLEKDDAITVDASKMTFGVGGVSMDKVEGKRGTSAPENANKNLTIMLNKDGYDSEERACGFVSYVGDDYPNGYSYCMKLSNKPIKFVL